MTGRIKLNEDNIFRWLVGGSLLLAAVLGVATALIISPRFGASVFAGGILATADFIWLRRGLEAALNLLPANASRFAIFRFILRLAIMALLLYILIVPLGADIIALFIGLSVMVLNIIVLGIFLSTRKGG